MSRTIAAILLATLALAVSGCSDKKSEPGSTAALPGVLPVAVPAKAPPATPPAPAADAQKIDCEKLYPKALRDKYAPGLPMTQKPICPGCPEGCEISGPDGQTAMNVMADCRTWGRSDWYEEMVRQFDKQANLKKLEGVGRAAWGNDMQVVFVARKNNCMITTTWFGSQGKLNELVKEIDAGLTPAALGL